MENIQSAIERILRYHCLSNQCQNVQRWFKNRSSLIRGHKTTAPGTISRTALVITSKSSVTHHNVGRELHSARCLGREPKLMSCCPTGQIMPWVCGPDRRGPCHLSRFILESCESRSMAFPFSSPRLGRWSICHVFSRIRTRSLVSYHYEMTGLSELLGVRRTWEGADSGLSVGAGLSKNTCTSCSPLHSSARRSH